MSIRKRWALFIVGGGSVVFMGCAAQQPAISDIRHDVVKVQYEPLLENPLGFQHVEETNNKRKAAAKAEAERGCLLYERGVSNLISVRCVEMLRTLLHATCMRSEYLFACTKD